MDKFLRPNVCIWGIHKLGDDLGGLDLSFDGEKYKFWIKPEGVSRYGMNYAATRLSFWVSAMRAAEGECCIPRYAI